MSPTIPSLINIGYFSLSLTISLNAPTTSVLTILGLPRLFIPSSPSNIAAPGAFTEGEIGDAATSALEERVLKSVRTTLTRVREASERRRTSEVRGMRARRASRGVEADEGEPRKRRELETARK